LSRTFFEKDQFNQILPNWA